jgi:hypothetical protein
MARDWAVLVVDQSLYIVKTTQLLYIKSCPYRYKLVSKVAPELP